MFNPQWPCRICGRKHGRRDEAEECAEECLRLLMCKPPRTRPQRFLRPVSESKAALVHHGAR